MSEVCGLEELAAILEDETARTILTETCEQAMSAKRLSQRCDVSEPTVYRRLEDMRRCDLLEERTRPDPDGHHHKVYSANLERIVVEVDGDGLRFEIDRREDMADRFTRLIEGMR